MSPAVTSGAVHRTRRRGPVAVVSDGSALPGPGPGRRLTLVGRLGVEAEILGRLSRLTVTTRPVGTARESGTLVAAIRQVDPVGAIFLTGVEAVHHQ